VFFHVYLSFPSGRLQERPGRVIVGAAYFVAVGLQLMGLALGGLRPDNVLAIVEEPDLALTLLDVQLVTLALLAVAASRCSHTAGISPVPLCVARRRCWWTRSSSPWRCVPPYS
jgi:hypothetical protein